MNKKLCRTNSFFIKTFKKRQLLCLILSLFIIIFCISCRIVEASSPENRDKVLNSPLNLGKLLGDYHTTLKEVLEESPEYDPTFQSGTSSFLSETMLWQWPITRAMVIGYSDLNGLINIMKSDEFKKTIVFNEVKGLQREGLDKGLTDTAQLITPNTGYLGAKDIVKTINQVDLNWVKIKESQVLKNHKEVVASYEKLLKYPIFSNGKLNTPFRQTQFVSGLLLTCAIMGVYLTMVYKSFIHGKVYATTEWVRPFFSFIFSLFIIAFIGKMGMFGVSYCDNIKGAVFELGFQGKDPFQVVSHLLDTKKAIAMVGNNSESFIAALRNSIPYFAANFLSWIAYYIAVCVVFIMVIVADVMMGLSLVIGPLVVVISFLPSHEKSFASWVRGYITLLFYTPLMAVYLLLLVAMLVVGIDTSAFAFMVISVAYIMGASKIPDVASNLSGVVLAGGVVAMAWLPTQFAGKTVGGMVRLPFKKGGGHG